MFKIKHYFKNKILSYLLSRYVIYAIQFVSLTIIANRLGAYNYGIWGFILLLISYLNIINFGIGHSINVYVVQFKNQPLEVKDYVASSFVATFILISTLAIIGIIYAIFPEIIPSKYRIGYLFYGVLIVGSLQYLNLLMSNIYRAQNRLMELAIYQSSVPVAIFMCSIIFSGKELINALVFSYIFAQAFSLTLFICRKGFPKGGNVKAVYIRNLFTKGIFLFLYNACFYLILNSTSTLVSLSYSVNEYGLYSLSYTLGHSILLIMEAFTFIVFPKVIDKFYTGDIETVKNILKSIRTNYVVLTHGLIYVAFVFFPLLIKIFPKYDDALPPLNFMILAIVLSSNSFGFNTLLIARNKGKKCATISIISLIFAISIGIFLSKIIEVPFYYMIIGIACAYIMFAVLCSYVAQKVIYGKIQDNILLSVFPINLLIPYIVAVIIVLINIPWLVPIPLIVYLILNVNTIKVILTTFKQIIRRPNFIDIKKV